MPATVNSTVGSCGIRLADGTTVWPRAAKNSRKVARSSSAVRGGTPRGYRPSGACRRAVAAGCGEHVAERELSSGHLVAPLVERGRPPVAQPGRDVVGSQARESLL